MRKVRSSATRLGRCLPRLGWGDIGFMVFECPAPVDSRVEPTASIFAVSLARPFSGLRLTLKGTVLIGLPSTVRIGLVAGGPIAPDRSDAVQIGHHRQRTDAATGP